MIPKRNEPPTNLVKDEIFLSSVEKIGTSTENIVVLKNVLSKDDHEKLLNFATNIDDWYIQPWKVKVFFSETIPDDIIDILVKIFEVAYHNFTTRYGVKVKPFQRQDMHLVRFDQGYSMHMHVDTLSRAELHLASVYYINDDYEGGEINFPDHNLKIKPDANSLIIFPGTEAYRHETLEVIGKERYTSTLFFQFAGSTMWGKVSP